MNYSIFVMNILVCMEELLGRFRWRLGGGFWGIWGMGLWGFRLFWEVFIVCIIRGACIHLIGISLRNTKSRIHMDTT
jgi:hypothetical protein